MQYVFVLDHHKQPLMPCHPARARKLLTRGKAAIFRRYPFTIILKGPTGGVCQPSQLKLDPGSKVTGVALIVNGKGGERLVWAAEIEHRGQALRDGLFHRAQLRRGRRQRKTRYRPSRRNNRRRSDGWLPPSVLSRVQNTGIWCGRLSRFAPVSSIALELVKFDTQAMLNPEIRGVEYQHGTLHGYEVREYLLEKWGRICAYCGVGNIPLEIEHVIPKSRGGSDQVRNLTLACHGCNQAKGNQTAVEFGHADVQRQAQQPLKDAAAINATRWAQYHWLNSMGLPLEVSTGARTKYNRTLQDYPKAHWVDAACIGISGERVFITQSHSPLFIRATGHGSRQICRTDKYGFPIRYRLRRKRHFGFQTGDMIQASIPSGKYKGAHVGRVACRATGKFDITTPKGKVSGISWRHCHVIHHSDGYTYSEKGGMALSALLAQAKEAKR